MNFIKKHYKLLIFFIVIILINMIYNFNTDKNIVYLSLGDDLALGRNSYDDYNYGYSDYLKNYYKKLNALKLYNNSFSEKGLLINDLYNDILLDKKIENTNLKEILRESNLLTISIGMYDILLEKSKTVLNYKNDLEITEEIGKRYETLLTEIRKYYKGNIYIIGMYPLNNTNVDNIIIKINDFYKTLENKKITYIDISNINTRKYFSSFNNYPNVSGYREIFQRIIKKIK